MIPASLANILKLFLPSWNFFSDFSAVPRLDFRFINDGRESDWQPLYTRHSTSSIRRIFFNPDGNVELLEKTFIERAAEDDHPRSMTHHETLTRIVRSRLIAPQPNSEFQFRLAMTSPGEPEEILFVSARHSIREECR